MISQSYQSKKRNSKIILKVVVIFIILILFMKVNFKFNSVHNLKINITHESCPIPNFENLSNYSYLQSSTLNCEENPIVKVVDGIIHIEKNYECVFQCIKYVNDYLSTLKYRKILEHGNKVPCPFFLTMCKSNTSNNSTNEVRDLIISVDNNSRLIYYADSKAIDDELFDILIIGVGSLSYNAWKHNLPETFRTFHQNVDGISFKKYNTLGDGATSNLHALLTGTKYNEVYESRNIIEVRDHIDDYNWIWNYMKKKGYVTSFTDDDGTFQRNVVGFRNQPTDYYMRTAFLEGNKMKLIKKFCILSKPIHKHVFDFQKEFERIYSKVFKFSLIFLKRYSTDDGLKYLDHDLSNFILNAKLNNPNLFLILFSDDGKYEKRSREMIKKYEERLPFMGISLPKKLNKTLFNVLKRNSEILTSPLDIHATVEDLIGIYNPDNETRHLSLLRPLPDKRNCKDIDVNSQWCSCFDWKKIANPHNNITFFHLAQQSIKIINNKTAKNRSLFDELTLYKVIDISSIDPTLNVLKFKKSFDAVGFIPDFSDETKQDIFWYQFTVIVNPNKNVYTFIVITKIVDFQKPNQFSILNIPYESIIKLRNPNLF